MIKFQFVFRLFISNTTDDEHALILILRSYKIGRSCSFELSLFTNTAFSSDSFILLTLFSLPTNYAVVYMLEEQRAKNGERKIGRGLGRVTKRTSASI